MSVASPSSIVMASVEGGFVVGLVVGVVEAPLTVIVPAVPVPVYSFSLSFEAPVSDLMPTLCEPSFFALNSSVIAAVELS